MEIRLKRAYEAPGEEDGFRILVDRLWPRGVSRDAARIDLWLKEISPSDGLRKAFAHDLAKWEEFKALYGRELDQNPEAVEELRKHLVRGTVTLVYGARDGEHNNAVALREYLESERRHS